MIDGKIIRYCHYGVSFDVLGFYSNEQKNILEPNVVITLDAINAYNLNQHTHINIVDGEFVGFYTVEPAFNYEDALAQAKLRRKMAYKEESEDLYMQWQFDETPKSKQIWRDKVTAINDRIPLPTPPK